jgi:hemoglobin-like flavoprotein
MDTRSANKWFQAPSTDRRHGRAMMTAQAQNSIRSSYHAITPHADVLADRFFARLFAAQPALRAMLPRDHWQRSHDLIALLGMVVKNANRPEVIQSALLDFGAKAQRVGVMPQQYGMARQALLDSMKDVMGTGWTEEVETDWTDLLNTVMSVVVLGAGRSRARAA